VLKKIVEDMKKIPALYKILNEPVCTGECGVEHLSVRDMMMLAYRASKDKNIASPKKCIASKALFLNFKSSFILLPEEIKQALNQVLGE